MNIIKRFSKNYKNCLKCNKTEKDLYGSNYMNNIFSDEGFCLQCEIFEYPERFHGCGFCRRPIRQKFSCQICSNGFKEWVKQNILPINIINKMMRDSAHKLVDVTLDDILNVLNDQKTTFKNHNGNSYNDILIKRNITHDDDYDILKMKYKFIIRITDNYYNWPGFYAGKVSYETYKKLEKNTLRFKNFDILINNNTSLTLHDNMLTQFPIWILPTKINKNINVSFKDYKLTTKIFRDMLYNILLLNNINLYDSIQIDIDKLDLESYTINSYDTRIVKI